MPNPRPPLCLKPSNLHLPDPRVKQIVMDTDLRLRCFSIGATPNKNHGVVVQESCTFPPSITRDGGWLLRKPLKMSSCYNNKGFLTQENM